MDSFAKLQKIKEDTLKEMALREQEGKKVKVIVGMGTCGIAAGAREVLEAVLDEINKRNLKGIIVTQTGCIGLCAQEPLMEIHQEDGSKFMYGNLNANKARQIVAQHLVNGVPVQEMLIEN